MPAYVIVETDIHDVEQYEPLPGGVSRRRRRRRRALRRPRRRARRARGRLDAERLVILEFADLERDQRWYDSPAYQEAKALREGAATAPHGRRRGRLEQAELFRRQAAAATSASSGSGAGGGEGAPEELGDAGEVGLEHLEHRGRVQRGRRVVERIERHAAAAERRLLLLPVHARDAERPAGEELRREVAERRDDRRLDQLDLPEQVALARLDLVRLRVAVAREAGT